MKEFHQNLFLWLNQNLNSLFPEIIWEHFSIIGNSYFIFAIMIMFLYYKSDHIKTVLGAGLILSFIVQGLKRSLNFPRPPKVLEADSFIQYGKVLYDFSFPSGHTATAFFGFSLILFFTRQKRYKIIAFIIALFAGLSRAALGVHWPVDIFIGSCFAVLVVFICKNWIQAKNLHPKTEFVFWILSTCILFYCLITKPFPPSTWSFVIFVLSCSLFFAMKSIKRSWQRIM